MRVYWLTLMVLILSGCGGDPLLKRENEKLKSKNLSLVNELKNQKADYDKQISSLKSELAEITEASRNNGLSRKPKNHGDRSQFATYLQDRVRKEAQRMCSDLYSDFKTEAQEICSEEMHIVDMQTGELRAPTREETDDCINENFENLAGAGP
jgi:hypothetical protein